MLEKLLRKTIWEQVNRAYEAGMREGIRLGRELQRAEDTGSGVILSARVKQDIEQIMERKGL